MKLSAVRCVLHDRITLPLQGRLWCPDGLNGLHEVDKAGNPVEPPPTTVRRMRGTPSNQWH